MMSGLLRVSRNDPRHRLGRRLSGARILSSERGRVFVFIIGKVAGSDLSSSVCSASVQSQSEVVDVFLGRFCSTVTCREFSSKSASKWPHWESCRSITAAWAFTLMVTSQSDQISFLHHCTFWYSWTDGRWDKCLSLGFCQLFQI